jgi:hypothetical protein
VSGELGQLRGDLLPLLRPDGQATADDHRIHHQPQLVDQAVAFQLSAVRVLVTTCLGIAFIVSANSPSRSDQAAESPS